MAQAKRKAEFQLPNTDNQNVIMSIDSGDGQVEYSAFKDFNGNYVHGIVQNQVIGTVNNAKGKTLTVTTLVADTNPNSNKTSIKIIVNGKEKALAPQDADKDEGIVTYVASVKFI